MIKMPIKDSLKSKGMLAGYFLIGLGMYVIVEQKDVTGGMAIIGGGLGVLGIRDKDDA